MRINLNKLCLPRWKILVTKFYLKVLGTSPSTYQTYVNLLFSLCCKCPVMSHIPANVPKVKASPTGEPLPDSQSLSWYSSSCTSPTSSEHGLFHCLNWNLDPCRTHRLPQDVCSFSQAPHATGPCDRVNFLLDPQHSFQIITVLQPYSSEAAAFLLYYSLLSTNLFATPSHLSRFGSTLFSILSSRIIPGRP